MVEVQEVDMVVVHLVDSEVAHLEDMVEVHLEDMEEAHLEDMVEVQEVDSEEVLLEDMEEVLEVLEATRVVMIMVPALEAMVEIPTQPQGRIVMDHLEKVFLILKNEPL